MSGEELQALVEQISCQYFKRPFLHRAIFNSRLQTTGGRYHLKDHHLDFNPHLFAQVDQETIAGIIKHELCHYHLHLLNRGYQHKDADFKALLKTTGGLRYAPSLQKKAQTPPRYLYVCQNCGESYRRKRRINLTRFCCGKCRGKLKENLLTEN